MKCLYIFPSEAQGSWKNKRQIPFLKYQDEALVRYLVEAPQNCTVPHSQSEIWVTLPVKSLLNLNQNPPTSAKDYTCWNKRATMQVSECCILNVLLLGVCLFSKKINILVFQYKIKTYKTLLKLQISYIGFSCTREAKVAVCNFRNYTRKEICSFTLRNSVLCLGLGNKSRDVTGLC